jgi:hypothetical protein
MARNIESFRKDAGSEAENGYVVHPGETRLPLGHGTIALPFAEL